MQRRSTAWVVGSLRLGDMVRLSRLDSSELYVNAEMIEIIEVTPDTVISLISGKKFIVRESAEEVVSRIISYRQKTKSLVQGDALGVSP